MFLLDAGGAALILLIPIAFIFLLFIWGLVEGFIINLFRINRFWKSVWHAIIVNIVSLIIGFVSLLLFTLLIMKRKLLFRNFVRDLP
jgi:hypothetical protein